jgi:hypothetical protein
MAVSMRESALTSFQESGLPGQMWFQGTPSDDLIGGLPQVPRPHRQLPETLCRAVRAASADGRLLEHRGRPAAQWHQPASLSRVTISRSTLRP